MRALRVRTLLLSLVLIASLAAPAAAQRSLTISRFDADVRVNPDGTLDVIETIRARFSGSWNGIYRTIPVEYRTPQGFNYTLGIDVLEITDGGGARLRYDASRQRHYRKFKIWVPGAVNASRTVRLRYRVRNGLRFFDEHDELYWNVTGDEWEVPIELTLARVHLPPGVAGLRASAFTGGYGSVEQAAFVTVGTSEVTVQTLRPLSFKEGLTLAVGWDPGIVVRPGPFDKVVSFLRSNVALLVPPVVLVGMWRLWRRRGRDPRRRPIAARYEPPGDLSPAEAGTLVDNSPDMRDITATIVDLAVRGYLVIEETEQDKWFGLWSSKDYIFTLRTPRADWTALKPHERSLLAALFASSEDEVPALSSWVGGIKFPLETAPAPVIDTVRLSDLQNRFYKKLPHLRDLIYRRLIDQGCYASRPDRVRSAYIAGGVILGALIGVIGVLYGFRVGVAPTGAIVAGILSAAIVCGFGLFMPARTEKGTRALEAALGFEEFLRRVESDRFERVIKTPEMFEKYLPFAMAFGVERNWAKAFEDIYTRPPEWYRGGPVGGFRPNLFVGNLGQMSTRAAAVMASAPRSSGGSGFGGGGGGGGFSGGGFGGGGGGGF